MPRKKELPKVNRLVGLPAELKVEGLVSHAHCTEVRVSFPPAPRLCPKCGSSRCVVKDGGRDRTVRHVPCGGSGTLVTFRQRRYLCRDCGSTYYEPVYWIHATVSVTTWLYFKILAALNTPQSVRRIALDLCVTEGIVDAVLNAVSLDKPRFLPETLCIDEFSGESGTYDKVTKRWQVEKFHCILADGDSGFVHDVLPRMNKDFLKYHKSNSVAEGRNRAIKELKRNSYGRHSFENFRKRILMAFGPTRFQEETYTFFGEKRALGGRT